MSMAERSMVGPRSTIHSAIAIPMPPAARMPCELNPAATKKFFTSGASPTMNALSGVKLSGPFMKCAICACSSAGTSSLALRIGRAKCSQSAGSSPNSKSAGSSSSGSGLPSGSNAPTGGFPASSLT